MKVLLSLTILYLMVALSHEACTLKHLNSDADGCTDPYNGGKHRFGDTWNTGDCLECRCDYNGLECCTRYGGIAVMEGCKAVVDPETCTYKFYKTDDPKTPCPVF